jgi:hypothetical protein
MAKRLREEVDSSRFHGPDGHMDIRMSADENHWRFTMGLEQVSLKIEATATRQQNIQNETFGLYPWLSLQESLHAAVSLDRKSHEIDQATQRLSDALIVVDQHHVWRGFTL